ncbi:unnamed protein product [Rangifer tarandus platyrhynchus]|uniref:Uncharacterized protein n=1 Tax=Rangifer tarandus platyrhynchus TaxID=3082113 RepID=A0AC60A5S2_RANTA
MWGACPGPSFTDKKTEFRGAGPKDCAAPHPHGRAAANSCCWPWSLPRGPGCWVSGRKPEGGISHLRMRPPACGFGRPVLRGVPVQHPRLAAPSADPHPLPQLGKDGGGVCVCLCVCV